MPELVEDADAFETRGRQEKYNWSQLFDGNTWRLKQGEDFDGAPTTPQMAAYSAARRYDVRIRTRIDGNDLIIQALEGDNA